MQEMKIQARKMESVWESIRGLIGSKASHAILIHTRFGIHTFGLSFPIDVAILDSQSTIVTLKTNLAPWRVFFWNPKYSTVLELPGGFIENNKLNVGQKITVRTI